MRPVFKVTIGVLILLLSACEFKRQQAKTPPPPQPTAARAEPPPLAPASDEPLSTPQTQVRLPQPQPIDPEAVVTPPVPPEPSAPRPKRRRVGAQAAAPPAKPEPVETAEAPPPEAPPRRMEPVLPEEQRRQKNEEISARLREVEQTLASFTPRTEAQKHTVEQINNFKAQAYQAKDEGDIQKASGLAERALLLVQDLTRAR